MLFIRSFVFICFCSFHLFAAVQNSILPLVEKYEWLENLPKKRYSKNQYAEIENALLNKEHKIRLVSFNTLFDLYDYKYPPIYKWSERKKRVIATIKYLQPDLLSVQELYPNQLKDLENELNEFVFISAPLQQGELNGIFFRKTRFQLIEEKIFYIPEDCSETLTMVVLQDLLTEKTFALFNTHLAFLNIEKRESQTRCIAEIIKNTHLPLLLTGDFNTFPNRLDLEKLPAYDGNYIEHILKQAGLQDAKEESLLGHLGPISTFTNSGDHSDPFEGTGTPGIFLDHIFVANGITVLIHAVDPIRIDGYFPSDHMPVLIDFTLCGACPSGLRNEYEL